MSAGFTRRQLTLAALAFNDYVRRDTAGRRCPASPLAGPPASRPAPAGRRRARHRRRAQKFRAARQAVTARPGRGRRRSRRAARPHYRRARRTGRSWTRRSARASATATSTSSTCPAPSTCDFRADRWPGRSTSRHTTSRCCATCPTPRAAARRTFDIRRPKDGDLSRCPGADPDPRRWLDDRQQGATGHLADEPNGSGRAGSACPSNYRLAPKHQFPTQIVDVKRAIAWVHENIKEYGGDSSYVVITGGSAGGHLAAPRCADARRRGLPARVRRR